MQSKRLGRMRLRVIAQLEFRRVRVEVVLPHQVVSLIFEDIVAEQGDRNDQRHLLAGVLADHVAQFLALLRRELLREISLHVLKDVHVAADGCGLGHDREKARFVGEQSRSEIRGRGGCGESTQFL